MKEGREALQPWSLTMAIISLAAMATWLVAPAWLTPEVATLSYALCAIGPFGYLFLAIGGYRRWADRVTFFRVLLGVVLFAGHAFDPVAAWWKVGVATLVIVLDGVDGAIARRQGPTEHGAVFDMESDAFYLITMCGVARLYLGVTPWAFVIGGLRPLYVCLWAVLRFYREPPSPNRQGSQRGRSIHVALVVALIIDLAPWLPLAFKHACTAVAVALIAYSYSIDVAALWRGPPRADRRGA